MEPKLETRKTESDPGWRPKFGWLVVDKIALGAVAAIIAFLFNAQLQKNQKVDDYHKTLFEKRVKAYEDLMASARDAGDRCALAYRAFLATRPSPKAADIAWQVRLAAAGDGIWNLADGEGDGGSDDGGDGDGGGGDGRGVTKKLPLSQWEARLLLDAIKGLQELAQKRAEASLFISIPVNLAIDRLLETLLEDLEVLKRRIRKSKGPFISSMSPDDQHFVQRALLRAEETYGQLLRAVSEALRMREMILG